jgi:hypothetical protein
MNTEPATATAGEALPDLEAATDEAISLRALLVHNGRLEHELALTRPVVSYGFTRGWHHRRRQ